MTNSVLDFQIKVPSENQSLSKMVLKEYVISCSTALRHQNLHSKIYPPSCLHHVITFPSPLCENSNYGQPKMLRRGPDLGWRCARGIGLLNVQTFKCPCVPILSTPSLSESMPQGLLQSQSKRIAKFC